MLGIDQKKIKNTFDWSLVRLFDSADESADDLFLRLFSEQFVLRTYGHGTRVSVLLQIYQVRQKLKKEMKRVANETPNVDLLYSYVGNTTFGTYRM